MDKEVLEVVLKRLARESMIHRVLEVEANSALPKGENYTSNIMRVKVKAVLGNGRIVNKSFILKEVHTGSKSGELFQEYSVAAIEAEIYSVIHKEMTYLIQEYQDTDETLWCRLIHYNQRSSSLLFEDLKPLGYKLVPRQQGLDLDHTLLAVRGLARYHAMAKVLEERGIVSKDKFKPHSLIYDKYVMKFFLFGGIRNTAKAMKEGWGPQWEEIAEKILKIPFDKFSDKLSLLSKPLDGEFTCLNHGDCWSNNIMFKYDWRNRPIAVKFVDYQGPHHNSPCVDLTYFMMPSVQPPVRRENYPLLLQTYHQCLVSMLDKFGYCGNKPTLQDITSSMERLSFYGLSMFASMYPVMTCAANDALDINRIIETDGEMGFNVEIVKEQGMRENMGPDIMDYFQKHLSDLLK